MEIALTGVRVLDLSRFLAGPYCSLILGDLGAEVIKIEAVGGRQNMGGLYRYKGQDAYHLSIDRSKKSITLDLRKREGRDVFHDLVKVSDVVLDNFRAGVLKRFGADYETLKKVNPRVISCSITGFGPDGPLSDRPAFDLVTQAMSGAMSITGEPGRPPVRSGVPISDQGAGMFAAHGILAALYRRERTGVGDRVETSLLEATVAQLSYEAGLYLITGEVPGPLGSGHRTQPFYGAFATRDGYIVLAGIGRVPNVLRAIGRPEMAGDKRFQEGQLFENKDELNAIAAEAFLTKSTDEWLVSLAREDVPCGPVNDFVKAFADEQVLARDMVVTVEHPVAGKVRQVGNPINMAGTPPEERLRFRPAPALSEHTDEILSGLLGYSAERIEQLRREKTI